MFGLWDAEVWGYGGSQRFVKEIISFECDEAADSADQCKMPYKTSRAFENVNIDKISHMIHLTQGTKQERFMGCIMESIVFTLGNYV